LIAEDFFSLSISAKMIKKNKGRGKKDIGICLPINHLYGG
jgi:hypothetical protein